MLLAGHPKAAWPAFLSSHPGYDRAAPRASQRSAASQSSIGFERPRLVVAIPLDNYPAQSHPLEHIVLSQIEAELARRHGLRVALTEESHLLDLVEHYVMPQAGAGLDEAAVRTTGEEWQVLRARAPEKAAEVALEFLSESGFPLNWRRSRAEAWGVLRAALESNGIDGPVVLLDELGMFLAGKDRRGLNADASFLQYLAQRTPGERCWLVCVTQRGLEEVGDIDRRTLRQLRDRFRPGFTLGLADLGWVMQHRLIARHRPDAFTNAMPELHASYRAEAEPFSVDELARAYPLNPLCLEVLQRAAETCLSQTRSAVRLLQEAAREQGWLERPAERLITPDVVFDLFREEMALTGAGQRHLHAYEVVMANSSRIAPGREQAFGIVMKALCLLGLAELRWSVGQLRASLVGDEEAELWRRREALGEMLSALYQRGAYVERVRGQDEEDHQYYVDVSSDASERIRQRLNELVKELAAGDSRVSRAALEACREDLFPLAGLAEPRRLSVEWWQARRHVTAVCRDLSQLSAAELQNLVGSLEAPTTKEDGWLFISLPATSSAQQEHAWQEAAGQVTGRFASGLLAWLPKELSGSEQEQLVEHAALSRMVSDPTVARPRDRELRARLRQRWEDSEVQVRRTLQRAYYEGRIIEASGATIAGSQRLSDQEGWDRTLAEAFAGPFRRLFPQFPSLAPERRLAGRAQTNQIIDQFIRPGEVTLPPASALEAHLIAYARPLGLAEGEDRHWRLALNHRQLVQAALAATPAGGAGDGVDPDAAISYAELAGRLAKSEWGITPEQSELLVAALIRSGYLVGLDAFLQPVRLEAIAAPLGENLPFVMRGAALEGETAEEVRRLWLAASRQQASSLRLGSGQACPTDWDLPTQERAWGEMLAWSARLMAGKEEGKAAVGRAADAFAHGREEWAWAEEAQARAEAVAGCVEPGLTSRQGLVRLVAGTERLPEGVAASMEAVKKWRDCAYFLQEQSAELARLYRLICDEKVQCPPGSLLEKDRQALGREFSSSARLVSAAAELKSSAQRWLEAYRRHYLGWHASSYAAGRYEGLAKVRGSATTEAARRLARAGLSSEELAAVESELEGALNQRCLAGDPLPPDCAVCPLCGLRLGQQVALPEGAALAERVGKAKTEQLAGLRGQEALLRRRLAGCADQQIVTAVERLVSDVSELTADGVSSLLSEQVMAWLRSQLGQPKASRRQWRELEDRLRGKEMPKRDVVRSVEEWLGPGEEVVEIE